MICPGRKAGPHATAASLHLPYPTPRELPLRALSSSTSCFPGQAADVPGRWTGKDWAFLGLWEFAGPWQGAGRGCPTTRLPSHWKGPGKGPRGGVPGPCSSFRLPVGNLSGATPFPSHFGIVPRKSFLPLSSWPTTSGQCPDVLWPEAGCGWVSAAGVDSSNAAVRLSTVGWPGWGPCLRASVGCVGPWPAGPWILTIHGPPTASGHMVSFIPRWAGQAGLSRALAGPPGLGDLLMLSCMGLEAGPADAMEESVLRADWASWPCCPIAPTPENSPQALPKHSLARTLAMPGNLAPARQNTCF